MLYALRAIIGNIVLSTMLNALRAIMSFLFYANDIQYKIANLKSQIVNSCGFPAGPGMTAADRRC